MTAAPKIELIPALRLDIGCGPNKKEGHIGVDKTAFAGVDTVLDVVERWMVDGKPGGFKRWPWADGSVDAIYSSHFLEHLTVDERCHFFNESYRVLKPDGELMVIAPHWSNARAYGDPTHVWPPVSEWLFLYVSKTWRDANAPHTSKPNIDWGYDCDFEGTSITTVNPYHPELHGRSQELQNYATRNFLNVNVDIHAVLKAKK